VIQTVDAQRLAADARAWLGTPFAHQGRGRAGIDCAGLLLAALAAQGVHVAAPADYHPSAAAARLAAAVQASPLVEPRAPDAEPEPGDLLLFRIRREPQHLGLAVGAGRMVHAAQPGGVAEVTLSALWRARIVARYGWR
jgi:cell wall-associated NlpC family hydrolase